MPRKQKLDNTVQEFMVVEDPAAIKLLFTPGYTEVLKLIQDEELSLSDIARALDVNPGSVHYHLKELEKRGLVKRVREEIKGGVVKKYYRKAARNMTINVTRPGNEAVANATGFGEEYKEKMLKSLSFFGYNIPSEKLEEAKKILVNGDKRTKGIMKELQRSGLEKAESNKQVVADTYELAMLMKLFDDEEFRSCVKQLIDMCSKENGGV
jgi:DNA-binding MarR family transcriptional regulator